jgi:hypothetical protein
MIDFKYIPTDNDLEAIVSGVISKNEKPKWNYKALVLTFTIVITGVIVYHQLNKTSTIKTNTNDNN